MSDMHVDAVQALTPAEIELMLDWATPGEWKRLGTPTIWADQESGRRVIIAENRTTNLATGDLLAAAPDLARQVIALLAENAQLRAQAGAVAGLEQDWRRKSNVCFTGAERCTYGSPARSGLIGEGNVYAECADELSTALAQASAEGEAGAGAEGVG